MSVEQFTKGLRFAAAADADTRLCYITHINWYGEDIADGDVLVLTDTAGTTVFSWVSNADDTGCNVDICAHARGLIAETLTNDHGTVDVYLK